MTFEAAEFQSLTGRLQTVTSSRGDLFPAAFQSLTGRLQTHSNPTWQLGHTLFQSLTGRLQTESPRGAPAPPAVGFNPSQVGYKQMGELFNNLPSAGFNPSQVGYKHRTPRRAGVLHSGFNPSQVGYKLALHTAVDNNRAVSIPHR